MRHLILILTLAISTLVQAQFVLTPEVNKAQELIMDLRFDEAKPLLDSIAKQDPNNGMLPYLKSNMVFLTSFISNDERQYDTSIDSIETLIKRVKATEDDTSAMYKFVLSEMYFQEGTLHMIFGNNWSSAWAMLDAFGYIKANRSAKETFAPQLLADGVLNVALGSMPGKYKWLTNLFGYSGDVEKGLTQLRASTEVEQTPYYAFKKKAAFVYSYISFFLKTDPNFNVWDVAPNYKESPLLVFTQARIYRERGENEALIKLLKTRPRANRQKLYYLDFMLGKAQLNKLDPDADAALLTFLAEYPGQNNVKAAYRYLSWHYYLRGNNNLSSKYKQLTKNSGREEIGADKQALVDVSLTYNLSLLKGQLYFDGGYYQKALDALALGVETYKTTNQKISYHYRLGRIYQQQEELTEAIKSFKSIFKYEESNNTFEAGNAALQLGVIYETLSNKSEAEKYYQKALESRDYPFENGIHQKAKAGLSRLKSKS